MMKILGLILVIFYAVLMLFALWKQRSQNNSTTERLPSIFIGAGCLLLLAYALLYIVQNRSLVLLLILGMLGISAGTLQNGIRQKKVHLSHHIIRLIIEAAIVAICWMAMGGSPKNPGEMLNLETKVIDGALAIFWEERIYVPFCVVSKRDCGEQIGCLSGDTDGQISVYKGYPPEQWLVSWIDMDGGAMLFKEITVNEIPDSLEDEYHINLSSE